MGAGKKGYLTLNEWILANKRLNICEDEILLKRIFYYIQYVEDCEEENMRITVKGLGKFNEWYYAIEASEEYLKFRNKLQDNKDIVNSRYVSYY